MLIKRIEGETRAFGPPDGWDQSAERCSNLSIRDVDTQAGRFMVSAWEPTPQELEAMKNGATVKLWVAGRIHPVVAITVGDLEETKFDTTL